MLLPLIGGIPNIDSLQFAVAALPGYREAIEITSAADEWLATQPKPPAVDPALVAHISNEWIDAERAYENAIAEFEARRKIVQRRRELEANRATSIFVGGVDLILRALQADLTTLMGGVAEIIPELGGATTPEQAIAADAGATWKQLTALADDYAELRTAQEFVMLRGSLQLWRSCTPSLPSEDHCNAAFIKNIGDIWPGWRQLGLSRHRIDLSHNAAAVRDAPWPADRGPELLIWLVKSDAQAWIPTSRELREMWDERNTPVDDDAAQQLDDDSRHDSLLFGPLEAERKRQAQAAARRRKPDYNRIATPIRTSDKP